MTLLQWLSLSPAQRRQAQGKPMKSPAATQRFEIWRGSQKSATLATAEEVDDFLDACSMPPDTVAALSAKRGVPFDADGETMRLVPVTGQPSRRGQPMNPDALLIQAVGRVRAGEPVCRVIATTDLHGARGMNPSEAAAVLDEMAFQPDSQTGRYFAFVCAREKRRLFLVTAFYLGIAGLCAGITINAALSGLWASAFFSAGIVVFAVKEVRDQRRASSPQIDATTTAPERQGEGEGRR